MIKIHIPSGIKGFMEDKDLAKELRKEKILPALENGEKVILDFSSVEYATQSFIHALIGEALKRFGEKSLELIEFESCNQILKNIIEIVVNYSFADFGDKLPLNNQNTTLQQNVS